MTRILKELMTIVLGELGLTCKSTKLKIGNRSMRDMDAKNLNLHHERCSARMCQYLKGTEDVG